MSLVEVDGWLNIHAFLLWFYFQYFLLLFAFVPHLFHINSLFTILVLFNLRMGGYNCTILASLVEVDGGWIFMLSYFLFPIFALIICFHAPSISLTLILYSRSWCSLTWEWVVTINCTILVSLVEVDGWLNIHAFLLWFYLQYFLLYLLSSPIYFSHFNSLFTILVLFNLRMGGYNCTILVSLVEVDGWLSYLLSSPIYFSHFNSLFTILVLFNLRMGGYNCTILVSLVEVDGWLNIHAFLLRFLLHIFILYYLLYPSVISLA